MGQKWYNGWSPRRSQNEINKEFQSIMGCPGNFSIEEANALEQHACAALLDMGRVEAERKSAPGIAFVGEDNELEYLHAKADQLTQMLDQIMDRIMEIDVMPYDQDEDDGDDPFPPGSFSA